MSISYNPDYLIKITVNEEKAFCTLPVAWLNFWKDDNEHVEKCIAIQQCLSTINEYYNETKLRTYKLIKETYYISGIDNLSKEALKILMIFLNKNKIPFKIQSYKQ